MDGTVQRVLVKDSLEAIKKYTDEQVSSISRNMKKELETRIKTNMKEQLGVMKKHLRGKDIHVKRYKRFVDLEEELYNLFTKSLEPDIKNMVQELQSMVNDSMKFYKIKFLDQQNEDILPEITSPPSKWSQARLFLCEILPLLIAASTGIVMVWVLSGIFV